MERCKGMVDLLPSDMAKLRHLEHVFRITCLQSGFEEIKTPTLEYFHLFTASGLLTPKMLGGVYSFLDWDGWSGERVVLRPDSTIPIMRLFLENLQDWQVAKLFYVQNVFRFEPSGKEHREQWQCGAELIGSGEPQADAEMILLACGILSKLGFDAPKVHISHPGLLKATLHETGLENSECVRVLEQIEEGRSEAFIEAFAGTSELKEFASTVSHTVGTTPGFIKNVTALIPSTSSEIRSHLANLEAIATILTEMQCNYAIRLDTGVRFEYYTGSTFSFHTSGLEVGGGGRYDDMASLMGEQAYPAVGFSLYADQIMRLMDKKGYETIAGPRVLVKAAAGAISEYKECFKAASQLREAGYTSDIDHGGMLPEDCHWILEVQSHGETASFHLEDCVTGAKCKVTNFADVVRMLRGQ